MSGIDTLALCGVLVAPCSAAVPLGLSSGKFSLGAEEKAESEGSYVLDSRDALVGRGLLCTSVFEQLLVSSCIVFSAGFGAPMPANRTWQAGSEGLWKVPYQG